MQPNDNDTIFSLSSAPGRAGVAVFRVSGQDAARSIASLGSTKLPRPRQAVLRRFQYDDVLLDEGLVLWMPGPQSFTGEDCAEFHIHGSPAVIEAMGKAFFTLGLRQAEAGEFTRRAFANNKMDLTEAEGLADLIDSETEGQRRQALNQMQGGLRKTYEGLRESLLDALAQIEGEIDFSDEADVPDALSHRAYPYLTRVIAAMKDLLKDAERGERLRSGLDIAIIGSPNVGKSTLMNALTGRDIAITSDIAGTTRDIVESQLVIAGLPVRLSDTAGLRQAVDDIEAEGVRRAISRAEASDIRIYVQDSTNTTWDKQTLSLLSESDFVLINKSDLGALDKRPALPSQCFEVSAKTKSGLDAFQSALEKAVIDRFLPNQDAGLTRARHRNCIKRAEDSLKNAVLNLGAAPELAGEDIRSALHALKELAGEIDIENVFDRIFSKFCVGK